MIALQNVVSGRASGIGAKHGPIAARNGGYQAPVHFVRVKVGRNCCYANGGHDNGNDKSCHRHIQGSMMSEPLPLSLIADHDVH
jgi:hypothetical protein